MRRIDDRPRLCPRELPPPSLNAHPPSAHAHTGAACLRKFATVLGCGGDDGTMSRFGNALREQIAIACSRKHPNRRLRGDLRLTRRLIPAAVATRCVEEAAFAA